MPRAYYRRLPEFAITTDRLATTAIANKLLTLEPEPDRNKQNVRLVTRTNFVVTTADFLGYNPTRPAIVPYE